MAPQDSPSFTFSSHPPSKSLFSESPLASLSRNTGHGGEDLSLSELSLTDTPEAKPSTNLPRFSLFGPAQSPLSISVQTEDAPEGAGAEENLIREQDQSRVMSDGEGSRVGLDNAEGIDDNDGFFATPKRKDGPSNIRADERSREDELRSTLFQMQKLNAAFIDQLRALRAAESHNRGLLRQVEQSHKLLTVYRSLLSQTEHTTRLLLDPQWKGAEVDELHAEELAKFEALERERLALEETERLERLEQERKDREHKEELERQALERAKAERGKATVTRARGRGTTTNRGNVAQPASRGRGVGVGHIASSTTSGIRRPTAIARGSTTLRSRGRGA